MWAARFLTVVTAALVLVAPARAEKVFNDPAGDSGAAHDITALTVSNDSAQVVLSFPVPNPWPNLQQAEDQAWLLAIDVDRNPSTGGDGAEVRVFQMGGASVFTWNGSDWVDAPRDGISVRFEISSNAAAWRVQLPRRLLANTTGFDFELTFAKFAGDEVVGTDHAPDGGAWRYELVVTQCANGVDDDGDGKVDADDLGCTGTGDDVEGDEPITPRLVQVSVTPRTARPGAVVLVRARVRQLETGAAVASGSVTCTTRVGGPTRKRVTGRISAGVATCRLVAPRASRGTTVRGTMTIAGGTQSLPFSFRIG